MCTTNTLQQKIRKHTDSGDLIINFLADTIRGEYPDAKYHHKLEAAKLLTRFGFPNDTPRHCNEHRNDTPSPSMGEGRDGGDEGPLSPQHTRHSRAGGNPQGQGGDVENPPLPQGEGWGEGENILHNEPVVRESEALGHRTENSELKTDDSTVTHLDILNYDIAHLIRRETADGHTIVQFFAQVMTGPDKPFTPKKLRIRHADRMAAAREVLRRGFGHFGRRRKLVHDYEDEADAYDTLHTDLARRMREYTEHGTDAVRFLLDVMEDADRDEPYTWHHRVSAAQELIRRGWDTNYDAITPEVLSAYWHNQPSTRLSTGQKKHLAGLPTTPDDYNTYDTTDYATLAANLRESREKVPFVLSVSKDESAREPKNTGATPAPHSATEVSDEGKQDKNSSPSMSVLPDPDLDCYYEPLNPNDQAIFDHELRLESGDLPDSVRPEPRPELVEGLVEGLAEGSAEGPIEPSPAAWKEYEHALAQIREVAAAEGVPLLPNPLAGTLKLPAIRSP